MSAILSIVLALFACTDPTACADGTAPAVPAPLAALGVDPGLSTVCGDWIDLVALLDDPSVESCVVDVWQEADLVVVVALHALTTAGTSGCVWVGYYAFPASIYAHSVVTVPFNADEMD